MVDHFRLSLPPVGAPHEKPYLIFRVSAPPTPMINPGYATVVTVTFHPNKLFRLLHIELDCFGSSDELIHVMVIQLHVIAVKQSFSSTSI